MTNPKPAIALQPSHVEAYKFIETYRAKNVYSPEIDEIADHLELTQRQTYRVIDDLESLGYIKRQKRKKRSIRIAKAMK
jgi:DNA-binding MarR family transcriptional regulator